MSPPSSAAYEHSRRAWIACLSSTFRAALACTIVAGATLYSPSSFQRHVTLPAFSYVTVILVVMDATLGDTWQACWLAVCATLQSVGPAMLCLWLIGGPAKLSKISTSIAVAVAAFVVVLPEGTHLLAKRIALGQIVLIYVVGFIDNDQTGAIMHPLHVASSTAVGLLACVLALLLPIPRLATNELKESCSRYVKNASSRLKLLVKAFNAEDAKSALTSISRAKCLSHSGNKLIHNAKRYQEGMRWERIPMIKSSDTQQINLGDQLQEVELYLRGMEIALLHSPHPYLVKLPDQELKNGHAALQKQLTFRSDSISSTAPETLPEEKTSGKSSLNKLIHKVPTSLEELPPNFFMFCLKSLSEPLDTIKVQYYKEKSKEEDLPDLSGRFNSFGFIKQFQAPKTLMPALKCSLSLGMATMLGLMYSLENGFWAGLPVAISLASAREATFKVANVKAHGTVLGTVYGVLGYFIFQKFLIVRFFSLIPWFIFTNFLRSSRMYGQAGGISAIIGAVLILGRKNFGSPVEFAVARIIETFIGLSCSVAVEVALSPIRASTLARRELSETLAELHNCTGLFYFTRKGKWPAFEKSLRKLRSHVNGLSKCIGEADAEPNFWYIPFNSACYSKLSRSLSNAVDVLHFGHIALRTLQELELQQPKKHEAEEAYSWKGTLESVALYTDLKLFRETMSSLVKRLEEVISMKSLDEFLDKKLRNQNNTNNNEKDSSSDLESGETMRETKVSRYLDEDDIEILLGSYLHHSQEFSNKIFGSKYYQDHNDEEVKSKVAMSFTAIGYCMLIVMRETMEIDTTIGELIQWENPSIDINLIA